MPKLTTRSSKQQRYELSSYYPTAPTATLTTQRKVSEDCMQSSQGSSASSTDSLPKISSSQKFNMDGSYRTTATILRSSSSLSSSDASSTASISSSARHGSFRLKRPAPSGCLVDLAAYCCVSPVSTVPTAAPVTPMLSSSSQQRDPDGSPQQPCWGHFIDMLIPGDEDYYHSSSAPSTGISLLPSSLDRPAAAGRNGNDPYPKPSRRIQFLHNNKKYSSQLEGFFLADPTVGDAASQLSRLSF